MSRPLPCVRSWGWVMGGELLRVELVLSEVTRVVRSSEISTVLTPRSVLSELVGNKTLEEVAPAEVEQSLLRLVESGLVEVRSFYYFDDDLPGHRLLPDEEAKAFRGEPFTYDGSPGDPERLHIVFVPTQPADVGVLRASLSPDLMAVAEAFETFCKSLGRSPKRVAEEIGFIRSKRVWKDS